MRAIACFGLVCALGGAAFAQPTLKVEGELAEAVRALPHNQILTGKEARALNSAGMASGSLDLAEKSLFDGIASGQPVMVDSGDGQVTLRSNADAQRIARMLTGKIDIGAMWTDPARMDELVEMSRWAPVTWDATTRAAASQLYLARRKSDQANSFGPFRILLGEKWDAIKALPEADAREAGRAMLFHAVELVQEQNRKTYIELPGFVYLWLNSEETKASIR